MLRRRSRAEGSSCAPTGLAEWPDGTVAGRYAFIHALYRNVLYARVPIGHRVGLHLRIGARLERAHGARAGRDRRGARDALRARPRLRARGAATGGRRRRHALRQHGYREAADHATRALELLKALPDSPERTPLKLTVLHMMLGSALTAMGGPTTPEVEETYKRALELSEQAGDVPELLPVLLGLGWFYLTRGSLRAAREVGNRLLTMAETTQDPAVLLAAHHRLGLVSFYAGEFEAARTHLEQGITLYSPARSPSFALIVDSGASSTFYAAWTLWVLGYPAQASARMHETLALARSIAQPFTLAHIQRFAAGFYLCLGERNADREQAEACIAMSTEHGFDALLRAARFHRGWWLTEQGRDEQGLALMRAWVAACRDIRALALLPVYLAWLAEVHGRFGQPAEGLALVREALALGTESGNHYWAAELHRVMGTLTLQAGPGGEARRTGRKSAGADGQSPPARTAAEETAEAAFREALEIARRQRAKSFEVRAATSLSRLLARQGGRRTPTRCSRTCTGGSPRGSTRLT